MNWRKLCSQANGQIDSTIPLKMHYNKNLSAQAALNDAVYDLQQSRMRFDLAESSLVKSGRYTQLGETTKTDISALIQGCKNMMLGNLKWSWVIYPPTSSVE